jgi:hypothetical protein
LTFGGSFEECGACQPVKILTFGGLAVDFGFESRQKQHDKQGAVQVIGGAETCRENCGGLFEMDIACDCTDFCRLSFSEVLSRPVLAYPLRFRKRRSEYPSGPRRDLQGISIKEEKRARMLKEMFLIQKNIADSVDSEDEEEETDIALGLMHQSWMLPWSESSIRHQCNP